MSGVPYDVVAIGDFRFPGGTSTAVVEELRAQAAAGYRTGLIQLKGPILKFPHPFHPGIRRCLDEGVADLLDPDAAIAARLVLAHHPSLFTYLPRRALRIDAEARLLIVQHPPFDGVGSAQLRLRGHPPQRRGGARGRGALGAGRPGGARQFATLDDAPPLFHPDWHSMVDPRPGRSRAPGRSKPAR